MKKTGCFSKDASPLSEMKMLFSDRQSIAWDEESFKQFVAR